MKIAQSTCVKCHGIFPRTEMKQIVVSENAGTSFGLSKNLKEDSTSRGSFRLYRRNRKVWVCNDCVEEDDDGFSFSFYFWCLAYVKSETLR